MAHLLRIKYGATTLDLTADPYRVRDYYPQASPVQPIEVLDELRDGGEISLVTRRNITDSARLRVYGATGAALQSAIRSLETAMLLAEDRQRYGLGDRVYAEFQPDGGDQVYRSEILMGAPAPSSRAMKPEWQNRKVEVLLPFTRRFYWEGAEVSLPLTNAHGSGVTTGLTVYNHDDSGHDNYVEIAAGAVGGVLPTPARIEITNNFASASRANDHWLGLNHRSDPANFQHVLEAENMTISGGGSSTPSGSASNAYYVSWALSGTGEYYLGKWALSTAFLNACRSGYFRLLARLMSSEPGGTTKQLKFEVRMAVSKIWESSWISLTPYQYLHLLDSIQLPPYLIDTGDLYPLELWLYARNTAGGSWGLDLDCLHLFPLDGWQRLSPRGYGQAQGVRLVSDGIEDVTWSDGWSPPGKTGHYIRYGEPVLLWPGKKQRLYFLHSTNTGAPAIDRTCSIKVLYRPRVMTV